MTRKNSRLDGDDIKFIMVFKAFWESDAYHDLTMDEIMLYSLMWDRQKLSLSNGWEDENGKVFIYYSIGEICRKLRCGREKAVRIKRKLKEYGLIAYDEGRNGDPHRIHVLPLFMPSSVPDSDAEKPTAGSTENEPVPVGFPYCNNTEYNNTERNNTNQSGMDGCYSFDTVAALIKENIEYDALAERGYDMDLIDHYVDIMTRAVCSRQPYICMGADRIPVNMVRSRFMKFNMSHLLYVYRCMDSNTSGISNIDAYLLKALYNAPVSMTSYYKAKVQHDLTVPSTEQQTGGDLR